MDFKVFIALIICSALLAGYNHHANAEPLGGWDTFPGPVAEPDTTQGD